TDERAIAQRFSVLAPLRHQDVTSLSPLTRASARATDIRRGPGLSIAEVTSVDNLRCMPEERFTLDAKLSRFPRLGLAHLPTPLEPMKRLTEHLGGPRLWVKREDATGVGFGSNKLRKLDYVLHEAMLGKADTLVSGGVVQSNSQLQVAAAAAKLGLQCHLAV